MNIAIVCKKFEVSSDVLGYSKDLTEIIILQTKLIIGGSVDELLLKCLLQAIINSPLNQLVLSTSETVHWN